MALTRIEYNELMTQCLKDAGFKLVSINYETSEKKSFVFKMLVFLGLTQK